jgi:hypothetical protein
MTWFLKVRLELCHHVRIRPVAASKGRRAFGAFLFAIASLWSGNTLLVSGRDNFF